MKIGDKVKILQSRYITELKNRVHPVKGVVVNINGAYIYVKPHMCEWILEAYPNELRIF